MKKLATSLLLSNSRASADDIRYATGFHAPDEFFLLLQGKRRIFFLPPMEAARAKQCAPDAEIVTTDQVRAYSMYALAKKLPVGNAAERFAFYLHAHGFRDLALPADFPFGMACALKTHKIQTHPVASPFPERAIKSAAEIRRIVQSQRIAVAGFKAAVDALRRCGIAAGGRLRLDGKWMTSERLRSVIEIAMLEHGGVAEAGTIAAGGRQSAKPHEAGSGVLKAGAPIVLDIFPRHMQSGYWGDLSRTVVKGRAPAALRKMYRTVSLAQRYAFSLLRPGVPLRHVHIAVRDFFRATHFPETLSPPGQEKGFIHGLGHSVGLSLHEEPGLRDNPGRLRAGHVLSVEPGLYDPALGGVRIEDLVEITPDGYRILAKCPHVFEIP